MSNNSHLSSHEDIENEKVYFTHATEGTADDSKDSSKKSWKKKIAILLLCFLSVSVLFFALAVFLINAFNVSYIKVAGNSMQPEYNNHDGIFIQTREESPQREDLVVFLTPESWMSHSSGDLYAPRFFLKRAIGVPGDELVISEDEVLVNGEKKREPENFSCNNPQGEVSYTLQEGEYFLLGDNHEFSSDAYRLYCSGAPFEEIVVDEELVYYYGEELLSIDGGWGMFERYVEDSPVD